MPPLVDEVADRDALDVFHRQEVHGAPFSEIVGPDHVSVSDFPSEAGLGLEALDEDRIRYQFGSEGLMRIRSSQSVLCVS